tara:strand:+ start:160 stop:324 length:165 start_codon:yes stop_codon:yes gene_type:complete
MNIEKEELTTLIKFLLSRNTTVSDSRHYLRTIEILSNLLIESSEDNKEVNKNGI